MKNSEAIPLSIFVVYTRFIDSPIIENWKYPFLVSGLAALIVIISVLRRKIIFDRILLGVNLYLISGALAFITHKWWLYNLYYQLQASGMIVWIIATGIVTVSLNSKGFIGVDSSDINSIKKYSGYLLLICVFAFAFSFWLRTNILLSGFLPFTCLFLVQKSFKDTCLRK
ncbi:MAG: hypothetical protein KJ915_12550 [Candidatus Omnitrophica bacterium]|nr:hypothetical protein [Candidatus Omnitrophota bacterium]